MGSFNLKAVIFLLSMVASGGVVWYTFGRQDALRPSSAFTPRLPAPSPSVSLSSTDSLPITTTANKPSSTQVLLQPISGRAPGTNASKPTSSTVAYTTQYKTLSKQTSSPQSESLETATTVIKSSSTLKPGTQEQNVVARNLTDMVLPNPRVTFPMVTLLKQQWVTDLQRYLQTLTAPSAPVVLVMSNTLYQTVLINWLIAVRLKVGDPFDNILVIALDLPLHQFMVSRGFDSILVPANSVIRPGTTGGLNQLFTTRVVVIRMINYLGYDALHWDNDAIVLKNPMTLLSENQESDIVGSVGTFPFDIGGRWGFTICMGFILFRSTPQIENFWNVYSKEKDDDDQSRINHALAHMDITWNSRKILEQASQGQASSGFRITALSQKHICRMGRCKENLISGYYIWHRGGAKMNINSKKAGASRFWYLKDDWKRITDNTTAHGVEWLRMVERS